MHVTHLRLTDFRSYRELDIEFPAGIVALTGDNGQGKTNLVEAIAFLSKFRSHRAGNNAHLTHSAANRAIIQARLRDKARAATIELAINAGKRNQARLNGKPVAGLRDVSGLVRVVVFAPEDLILTRGEPTARRRYLDDLLVQAKPGALFALNRYDKVSRQRAALLKGIRGQGGTSRALAQLDAWNDVFIDAAVPVISARTELAAIIARPVKERYLEISNSSDELAITYTRRGTPTAGTGQEIARRLAFQIAQERDNEIARGQNLVGPHLDDLLVQLNGQEAKTYASHGEAWSIALALRLAEFELLRGAIELTDNSQFFFPATEQVSEPILILDDVFSQLDSKRRSYLAERIGSVEQIFITAATKQEIPPELTGTLYRVENSTLTAITDPAGG